MSGRMAPGTEPIGAEDPRFARWSIDPETAEYFGIRFDTDGELEGRIVFPVHNGNDEVIAYAGRTTNGATPIWKYSSGFDPSLELFNYSRACQFWQARYSTPRVVVVEDPLDCVRVHEAGFESVVALMGESFSQAQEDAIAADFGLVTVMLHNPTPARDLAYRLAHRVYVRIVDVPASQRVSELAPEEIRDLLPPAH